MIKSNLHFISPLQKQIAGKKWNKIYSYMKTKKLVNKWTHHSVQIGVTKKVKSGHVQSEWGSGKRSGWL